MVERKRGCGWRTVGKMYLCGTGLAIICDNLPYLLGPCDCCGYTPNFTRGLQWINKRYIKQHDLTEIWLPDEIMDNARPSWEKCECPISCPICYPDRSGEYGLMFVGNRYYSPDSFIKETKEMGVSKAIARIPKKLKMGKTWILLAHMKVPIHEGEVLSEEPELKPAIFYAFVPTKIEVLILESEATSEKLNELKNKGITPVIISDSNADKHTKK